MVAPNDIAPSLESLKVALGRLERATTRVELALRSGGSAHGDSMTPELRQSIEAGLQAAMHRIDAILGDDARG